MTTIKHYMVSMKELMLCKNPKDNEDSLFIDTTHLVCQQNAVPAYTAEKTKMSNRKHRNVTRNKFYSENLYF